MAGRGAKHLKALYFDLRVKDLELYFSKRNPTGAYGKIRDFLLKRNFSHEQYSGYHSKYKTTDLEIFDLIREMSRELMFFGLSLRQFFFSVLTCGVAYQLFDRIELGKGYQLTVHMNVTYKQFYSAWIKGCIKRTA